MAQASNFKALHQQHVRTFMKAFEQLQADLSEYEALGGSGFSDETTWPDGDNVNNELTKAEFDASFYAINQLVRFMSAQAPTDVNNYKLFFYRVAS